MSLEWFIFYTYPKAEKALQTELARLNYQVCLPLHKVQRQWKDRRKILELPLFPNYIFVKTQKDKVYDVLSIPRVVRYVSFEGKAATLKEEEINFIKQACESGGNIFVSFLRKGDLIRIKDGPLRGYTGTLCEYDGKKRFGLNLTELQYTVYIDLEKTGFERVKPNLAKVNA